MPDLKKNLERLILKKTFDEAFRPVPSYENILDTFTKRMMSDHPVRLLGYSKDGEVWMSEEDRENHTQIIGTTGEGKSKFIEMMICKDIESLMKGKSKAGVCFIDSSDNGNTMKKVLRYCCQKKFENVLLIDPRHIHDKDYNYVVPINPFGKLVEFENRTAYNTPSEAIQAHIAESIRINWESQFQTEAIISEYMPYVIQALHGANATLSDSLAFVHRHEREWRERIINRCGDSTVSNIFATIYKNEREYDKFGSTRRRFDPYRHSVLQMMFGSTKGVDFRKLISKGWVILVNLYDQGLFEEKHQRLLGTHILNEIILAISRIKEHEPEYSIPYYIYIDEFSQYATDKIADILYRSRQSGIRLNLAHQDFPQITNKKVLAAVRGQAKTKVAFYLTHPSDRLEVVQMCYGGALPDREVSYVLSQTKKQHAVVKIGKTDPQMIKVRDWPDSKPEPKVLKDYILKLYSNPEHYRKVSEVEREMEQRFETNATQSESVRRPTFAPTERGNFETTKRGKGNDGTATSKGNTGGWSRGKKGTHRDKQADPGQATDSQDIQVSSNVPVDYSDAQPFVKRRPSEPEQGSERKGGKG